MDAVSSVVLWARLVCRDIVFVGLIRLLFACLVGFGLALRNQVLASLAIPKIFHSTNPLAK